MTNTIRVKLKVQHACAARANAAASQRIVAMLRSGELADSPAPVPVPFTIGIGQSMGACVSIVAQALGRPFDALAVLGSSACHTVLPSPQGCVRVSALDRGRTDTAGPIAEAEEIEGLILDEDLRGGFPFRTAYVPPWGSATIPPAAASMLAPGVVADEAAALTVPIFIGVGERDVCPEPWAEPASYRRADHVTLCVVDRMAHMHNFASSRSVLWERLRRWGQSLP